MKVVLFAGGLGTRIRDYSEAVPKPMIPIGQRPILWHVMNYYMQYGHKDFVVCMGYKANIVKEFFVNFQPHVFSDCTVSKSGPNIDVSSQMNDDWRVTLVDTGIWRNIGERLMAVRDHVANEEIFLANYSDGLTDLDLDAMLDWFKKSGKVGAFLAVRPPLTYHLIDFDKAGEVKQLRSSATSDIWINGGYFIFRREIFDYIMPGEELVLQPFVRLIERNLLGAYRFEGFWRSMDTLRDRQTLEDLVEQGKCPWHRNGHRS